MIPDRDLESLKAYLATNRESINENPDRNHMQKFLVKLNGRFRRIVSIVPHLFRVAWVTVLVFAASILLWNNFIRKDRHEVTLREKITFVLRKIQA